MKSFSAENLKSMRLKFAAIANVLILVALQFGIRVPGDPSTSSIADLEFAFARQTMGVQVR